MCGDEHIESSPGTAVRLEVNELWHRLFFLTIKIPDRTVALSVSYNLNKSTQVLNLRNNKLLLC